MDNDMRADMAVLRERSIISTSAVDSIEGRQREIMVSLVNLKTTLDGFAVSGGEGLRRLESRLEYVVGHMDTRIVGLEGWKTSVEKSLSTQTEQLSRVPGLELRMAALEKAVDNQSTNITALLKVVTWGGGILAATIASVLVKLIFGH